MKILQVVSHYEPDVGGIETVAKDISNAIAKSYPDAKQKIICIEGDATKNNAKSEKKKFLVDVVDNIEVIRCSCIANVASQPISLTFKKQLKKTIESYSPDLVIFHYPNPLEARYVLKYLNKQSRFIIF